MIQPPFLIPAELKGDAHFGQTACKIRYNNVCITFGTWKVRRLNQSRSIVEIPGRVRRDKRLSRSKLKKAFLIDSDVEIIKNIIQFFGLANEKFGVWSEPYLF